LWLIVNSANAQCERFQPLPLDQQTRVLAGNDRSDRECTAFLIVHLGEEHYGEAGGVIVNYLDFEWRDHWADEEDKGNRLPWVGSKFPAFQALYSLEDKAVPALIDYLAGKGRPQLGRKHAVLLFLMLDRHGDFRRGLRTLVQATRAASQDPVVSGRLWQAANDAVGMCVDEMKQACRAVLIERPGH